jgi:peptide/nickel transport system substrate-binding protein
MRHIVSIWFAVSSLSFGALIAGGETRPHYGSTLHATMRAAPLSLDPADTAVPDSFAQRSLASLLFDTMVRVDDLGRARPALAESWQASRGNQRWVFRMRRGVKFHDGAPLTAEIAAASLRFANPSWNVSAEDDTVVIDRDAADPGLLGELALAGNSILKRDSDNKANGTGPFHVVDWQPAKKLTLAANEDYWRGRPFLDGVEIEMGKGFRDQMTMLELGKAELVEVAPEQAHRVSQEGLQLASSAPIELLALVFAREVSSPDEKALRQALEWSIDRASMRSVLLQGAGQLTATIVPNWMSGYGFVFPTDADLGKARQLRSQVRTAPAWTIGYNGSDPLARLVVERIALNARDAGLALQPTTSSTADLRLVRIPLASPDAWIALENFAAQTGLPAPGSKDRSTEDLYTAERAALATERVIPLFHLPATYAFSASLRNGAVRLDGGWDLADASLEGMKP